MVVPYRRRWAEVLQELERLGGEYGEICQVIELRYPTRRESWPVKGLRIGSGAEGDRPAALVISGIHAREWAPPEAVLSFAAELLAAYQGRRAMTYPAFTDKLNRVNGEMVEVAPEEWATYDTFDIPYEHLRAIVDALHLYVVPVVNPDGREFSFSEPTNDPYVQPHQAAMWRKNRALAPSGAPCPPRPPLLGAFEPYSPDGVDLNRNFPIAWSFETFYDQATQNLIDPPNWQSTGIYWEAVVSADPCHPAQIYRGPVEMSEPETENVWRLLSEKKVRYFVDVHSFGRKIMYPWSIAPRGTDERSSFTNRDLDRDPSTGTGGRSIPDYKEYLPETRYERLKGLAEAMRDEILRGAGSDPLAQERSKYEAIASYELYGQMMGGAKPVTGTSDDSAFSLQFTDPNGPILAFSLECGSSGDGEDGFHPAEMVKYRKIEREIHAMLGTFLWIAAAETEDVLEPTFLWPICAVATAVFGSPAHPHVEFLRRLRDEEISGSASGRRFASFVNRVYYSFSPAVARFLTTHECTRVAVRRLVVLPTVWVLRACALTCRPLSAPKGRSWALMLVIVTVLAGIVGLAGLGLGLVVRVLVGG